MQSKYCSAVLCLVSVFALGQNLGQGSPSTQTPIHGIKIVSSTFDPSERSVRLDFINDSPANITAWGYCVNAQKANESDPSQSVCTLIDAVPWNVEREAQERITLETNPADCPDCHFVHPGEHKTLSANFSLPVVSANIEINLIAYSNGKVEISGSDGASKLQQMISYRQQELKQEQELVDMAKKILGDPTNQHPTTSMINELQNRMKSEPALEGYLRRFKTPEWRKGNDKEFIPDDERGYLSKFLSEQEMAATELSKHQIQGVAQ